MIEKTTVIIGPTASGKSIFSINKAKEIDAEIISADAFQVYKDFNIGTGKLTVEEMNGVPHHLIDIYSPEQSFSVKMFIDDVDRISNEICSRQKNIIICGGSAMYLRSLLYGYSPLKRLPEDKRPNDSIEVLWKRLQKIDPDLAAKTPMQNKQRVQRYLELFEIYKKKPSELFQSQEFISDKYKVIGLNIDKDTLKEKINVRVDQMISNGLIDEVTMLMKKYNKGCSAFNAIGYKEVVQFIKGKITKNQMIDLIKKNTIQYSKKQMTWFKAFDNVSWINQ